MTFRRSIAVSVFSAALLSSCGGDEFAIVASDSIEILSVSPTTVGTGTNTEFTVNFRYTLVSAQSGVVDLGFFVDSTNQMLSGRHVAVAAGAGTGTLKATANPENYTTAADFAVGLLLSPEPHPESWIPLARAKQQISVSREQESPSASENDA